jgi:RHS repeat-associated protein
VLYDLAAAVVTAAGVEQLFHFDAYGNLLGDTWTGALQPVTSYLYSGESFDFNLGQQYLRARWYDAVTGRFNRLDPFFGNHQDPQSFHKYAYGHGDPISYNDPTGNFIGAVIGLGLELAVPGPGDLIQAGLEALVQAYAVNLEWDVQWALDFSLPDSWGSRLDNTWVYAALGAGLQDAYDIWTPFGTVNPLEVLSGDASFAARSARRAPRTKSFGGGFRARFSFKETFSYTNTAGNVVPAVVNFYRNTSKLGSLTVVQFPKRVIAKTVDIVPSPLPSGKRWEDLTEGQKGTISQKDLAAATKRLKELNGGELPNGYKAVNRNRGIEIRGKRYTWHHDVRKGRMQLVPQDLHEQTIVGEFQHVGHASWHKNY